MDLSIILFGICEVAKAINVLAPLIQQLAKAFGIISDTEEMDELGDQVIQAEKAGIVREDFKDFDQYVEAVKGHPRDPEISESLDTVDKLVAAVTMLAQGIEQRSGQAMTAWLPLVAANADTFHEHDRLQTYFKEAKTNGFDLGLINEYLDGELSPDQKDSVRGFVLQAEQKINSETTMQDVRNFLGSLEVAGK